MWAMWVVLALSAGLLQSGRNAFARSLSGLVSPALNSWSRFAFNLPFSASLFTLLVLLHGAPLTSSRYFVLCLATALTQLLGNVSLIAAFRHTTFAQAIVLHKLEILFTTVVGASFFSELPSALGWLGILVSAAGVVAMHAVRAEGEGERRALLLRFNRGTLLALGAGVWLALASFLLKEANTELVLLNPRVGSGRFEVAAHTLFHATWMEVVLLTVWLRAREPGELRLVSRYWRRMFWIGSTGFSGSLCWFWAYSLTLVAYVKAVGQVESIAAVVFSLAIWKEREVFRQLPGMALVFAGIVLVLIGGSGP